MQFGQQHARAGVSRRPPVASAPVDASRSSRSRSPSRAAACSTACRCAAQTESPSAPPGPGSASGRRIGGCVGRRFGSSGSISAHNASSTRTWACLTASLSVRRKYQALDQSTRGSSVNFATCSSGCPSPWPWGPAVHPSTSGHSWVFRAGPTTRPNVLAHASAPQSAPNRMRLSRSLRSDLL